MIAGRRPNYYDRIDKLTKLDFPATVFIGWWDGLLVVFLKSGSKDFLVFLHNGSAH